MCGAIGIALFMLFGCTIETPITWIGFLMGCVLIWIESKNCDYEEE